MISFNCIEDSGGSFDFLQNSGIFRTDDKILTREGLLKFATWDGTRFVGGLVSHDKLKSSLGYKIYYSGAEGEILTQGGGAKFPAEDVVVKSGWNWIGHAPLISYDVNSGIVAVNGAAFTADDQIKTRRGSALIFCTYTGSEFTGGLTELKPGVGYEVKVAQGVTFSYSTTSVPSDGRMLATAKQ